MIEDLLQILPLMLILITFHMSRNKYIISKYVKSVLTLGPNLNMP